MDKLEYTKPKEPESTVCTCEARAKAAEKELNDLLFVIRREMTSITRYVRYKRENHPALTEGQSLDRRLRYKGLAEKAVTNILEYINGKKESSLPKAPTSQPIETADDIEARQIMEMADDVRRIRESYYGQADYLFAKKLFENGYRKQSEKQEGV